MFWSARKENINIYECIEIAYLAIEKAKYSGNQKALCKKKNV